MKAPPRNPRKKGGQFEEFARIYLENRGLQHIESNYFCKAGEIDLILFAQPIRTLVFVEVKYRTSQTHGHALETITSHKQRKLKITAAHYLAQHPQFTNLYCRFDAFCITKTKAPAGQKIDWVENAFY